MYEKECEDVMKTEKIEYEIFEQKTSIEKIGDAIFEGDQFILNMEGRCFFLKPIKSEKSIQDKKKKKNNVRDGYFTNDILPNKST